MTYNVIMQASFEAEKNKKAFTYTILICGILLILAFIITWPILLPTTPPALTQDLLEINLGNNEEGFGVEQPRIKGERAPAQEPVAQPQKASAAKEEPAKDIQPDDNAEEDAAPIVKPKKATPKTNNIAKQPTEQPSKANTPVAVMAPPSPKPQKPKLTYNGPGSGTGNGATEDNGYRYQGNKPGGKGDAGDPSGKPDSYGNTPGGKSGGPRVIGNRKIIKYYSFTGDLDKATVYATVRVSPSGTGSFIGFGKNSTTRAQAYANAIIQYLRNVQFDRSNDESTVTVQFNFNVQ
ncbi:MAG: TonB C-terminal protein [Ferruginibacter sp.]|nr:TonB C-terminal protein [Ferruginibacter sp.]